MPAAGDDSAVTQPERGRSGSRIAWSVGALAVILGAAVFVFYFLVYRVRHFAAPVGFDTSWYVWRAEYASGQGIGALDTAVRPGHALLSSVLGSVSGLSQLELGAVLPLVLVSVFALAVGAFARTVAGGGRWQWAAAVVVTGTVLGTTRLVGENQANLLLLALALAALAALASWMSEGWRRSLCGAIGLLVAAGLAHWVFLAVIGAILVGAAVLALPVSVRRRREGTRPLRTETGALLALVAAAGAVMVATIALVLRAPFRTFEIREDPARFRPKLRTDLRRLALPLIAPAAGLGAAELAGRARPPTRDGARTSGSPHRGFGLRILVAWTAVSLAGVLYGALTLDLPPHRFVALAVAVPGSVAVAAAVWWLTRRTHVVVGVVAVVAFALPGGLAWYRSGPGVWMDPAGLEQARIAGRYVQSLPEGTPVVILVSPFGPAGLISVPLKERTIRVELPPDRQLDVHFFVGDADDLLARRRTLVGPGVDRETLPYWRDVEPVLAGDPPVLILRTFARPQFAAATGTGEAKVLAPDVALLRGPTAPPSVSSPASETIRAVPRTRVGLLAGTWLLIVLMAAGIGWSRAILGPAPPEVLWSAAPSIGAGVIILAALVATKLGVPLHGVGAACVLLLVTAGGWILGSRPPSP
jgi:hypothetical protein